MGEGLIGPPGERPIRGTYRIRPARLPADREAILLVLAGSMRRSSRG
jgi:hypothetical protein